ncbi:thioesterase-like superfamily-domain-containing protein, partial [Morchella snyderi]
RWLSDTKRRLGKLFLHGTTAEETKEASDILKDLTKNWRDYERALQTQRCLGRYAHVNNVTYARWAEASRINWAWNIAKHHDPQNLKPWSQLWTPKGLGLILKSIRVDYKFPVEWPDKVTVYHKLGDVSITSFTLDVIILSEKHQRPAARCHEDIVVYNYQPADKTQLPGKAHIPDFMKVQFDETLRLQKEAKEDALENIRDISKRVEGLEMRVLGRQEMT